MNDRTIVQHPNGYSGVLMGKSTMMMYDKDDNCIIHTCFRTPNTEKELYEVLETMPKFIEILASVEADRKTEPTCSKMEQVEDEPKTQMKTQNSNKNSNVISVYDGVSEAVRCAMCSNPNKSDRGCDGACSYDEKLYERIMKAIAESIVKTEPQTCSVNGRPYDCGNCEYHKCTADEPQMERPCDNCQEFDCYGCEYKQTERSE